MSNTKMLDSLKLPDDLKKITNKELEVIVEEIRDLIIDTAKSCSLHYSSNLGIIELSTMILKVFDIKEDIILYDTGHQTYTHKILTGRYKAFKTIRQPDGLAGLMNMEESKYDHYSPGHSGNTLSIASGIYQKFAHQNINPKISKEYINEKNIVAVVGDAAFANGLNFEALNDIAFNKEPIIVILNDNDMGISKPVGSMSKMFSKLQSSYPFHFTERLLRYMFKYNRVYFGIYNSFIWLQTRIFGKNLFQNLGCHYIGPIDGHNLKQLESALKRAKWFAKQGSVIVHVKTTKGKGDKTAEIDTTGIAHSLDKNTTKTFGMYASEFILELMHKHQEIRVINPAMSFASNCSIIEEAYPDFYIDVGISEEHALSKTSGMALAKLKVFVYIYSSFLQRAYDQLLHDLSRLRLGCTLLIDRADLSGYDGSSHHGIYDIGFLKTIHDTVITSPRNVSQLKQLIDLSYQHNNGIFAIRYPKNNDQMLDENTYKITYGEWESLHTSNKDVVIISYGPYINELQTHIAKVYDINLVNAIFITDYHKQQMIDILKKYKHIVVYERVYKDTGLIHDFYKLANELQLTPMIYGLHYKKRISYNSNEILDAQHEMDCNSVIAFLKSKSLIN